MSIKVKLLVDYRGVLTNEMFFPAGEYEMSDELAHSLIAAGRAEALKPDEEPTPNPPAKTTAIKRGTRK